MPNLQFSTLDIYLIVFLVVVWIWSAIRPVDRLNWIFDNILVFILTPIGIFIKGTHPGLSNLTFALPILYTALHLLGAHYSYVAVPFGTKVGSWFSVARNNYDRIVHFSWGFLFTYPLFDLLGLVLPISKVWIYLFTFASIVAIAGIYEIYEWLGAETKIFGKGEPARFLGFQGDIWDTQKDIFVAAIGSAAVLAAIFLSEVLAGKIFLV